MTVGYRFDRFELTPGTRQLLVDGKPAELGARAFDLLLLLVENKDRLVGKEELLDRVWSGLVVEENNIAVQISTLRKILGPDAITTVPGHGYRFTLPFREEVAVTPAAKPEPSQENLSVQVAPVVGREPESEAAPAIRFERDAPVVERVASSFRSMFSIVVSVTLTVIVTLLAIAVTRAYQDDSIYLEPVSVPPALIQQGITPDIVGARIAERIALIKSETMRLVDVDPNVTFEATQHGVVLVGGVGSLSRVVSAFKRALGQPDRRVFADITTTDGATRIGATFLVNGVHDDALVSRDVPTLDAIADVGAATVLKVANPDFLTERAYSSDLVRPPGPHRWDATVALLDFRELRGKEARSAEVRNWRAIIDYFTGNAAAALPVFEELARSGWKPAATHYRAAHCAIALGDEPRALENLAAARRIQSATATELADVGTAYRFLGKSAERMDTTRLAFTRFPNSVLARVQLAEALSEAHRESEALKLLDAVPIATNKTDMLFHVGQLNYVLMRMGNFQRIAELRQQYERFAPTHMLMRWVAAEDAVGRGDYALADAIWVEVDNHPTWDEPKIRRADIAAMRQDHADALAKYEVCLARFPYEGRCLLGKARSLVQLGDLNAADVIYGRLFNQDKDNVAALQEWSALKRKVGQDEKAANILAQADEAQRRLAIPIDIRAGR